MANKFTKSVLERQAKERRAAQSTHPPAKAEPQNTTPEIEATPTPAAEAEQQPITPVEESTQESMPATEEIPTCQKNETIQPPAKQTRSRNPKHSAPDLSAFIVRDEGRSAKNKTFYLDAAVIDALHEAAIAQKVTDSKLVNDILKKLLKV